MKPPNTYMANGSKTMAGLSSAIRILLNSTPFACRRADLNLR